MSAAIRPLESGELEDIDLESAGASPESDAKKKSVEEIGEDAGQRRRCRVVSPICVVVLLLVVLVLIAKFSVKYGRSGQSDSATSTTSDSS